MGWQDLVALDLPLDLYNMVSDYIWIRKMDIKAIADKNIKFLNQLQISMKSNLQHRSSDYDGDELDGRGITMLRKSLLIGLNNRNYIMEKLYKQQLFNIKIYNEYFWKFRDDDDRRYYHYIDWNVFVDYSIL